MVCNDPLRCATRTTPPAFAKRSLSLRSASAARRARAVAVDWAFLIRSEPDSSAPGAVRFSCFENLLCQAELFMARHGATSPDATALRFLSYSARRADRTMPLGVSNLLSPLWEMGDGVRGSISMSCKPCGWSTPTKLVVL